MSPMLRKVAALAHIETNPAYVKIFIRIRRAILSAGVDPNENASFFDLSPLNGNKTGVAGTYFKKLMSKKLGTIAGHESAKERRKGTSNHLLNITTQLNIG